MFVVSGIISPILINSRKANWEKILETKIQSSEQLIKNIFDRKIKRLLNVKNNIKSELKDNYKADINYSLRKIIDNENEFLIQFYEADSNLIFWNSEEIFTRFELSQSENTSGQAFFKSRKLFTYIYVFDTLRIQHKVYSFVLSLPVENKYRFFRTGEMISYTDYFSNLINTSVRIGYNPARQQTNDGRIHSFAVLNNYNNKIGVVEFEKPTLDGEISILENILDAIQSLLLILIYLSLSWIVYQKIKNKKAAIKYLDLCVFIILLRIILFITGIPSGFIANDLTDATNFSSTFAFGMVRSPLEFAITAVLGFIIILIGFKKYLTFYDSKKIKSNNWFIFSSIVVIGFFFILLILRGLGASLRSVVFDSSIRYFKEFNLIPDAATFIMDFNILLVGFSVFLICIIILMAIISLAPQLSKTKSHILFGILFIVLQIAGVVFDEIQKQPQGTPLIRSLFIAVLFILGYVIIFRNYRSAIKFLYIAFGASIATVSLLTYYNSEIERESLKTTAQDLTRSNTNIYQFMVYQMLSAIQNDVDVKNSFVRENDLSSTAFIEWTKSLLYREALPTSITFYDTDKNIIGNFSNVEFDDKPETVHTSTNNYEAPEISIIPGTFNGKTIIHGITAIKNNSEVLGYASVKVKYDENYFNFLNLPSILLTEKTGISSALNAERLKIFYFRDNKLEKSFGSVQLSENDTKKIIETKFPKHNEAWLRLNISGENYLFYLLKLSFAESNILTVAKEDKSFAWNLSDFFKVFFVHTGLILVAFFIIALLSYKKAKIFLNSYKTKLATAFIIVAAIPLLVIAIYFKSITDEINSELIYNRISETANQIDNYLNKYLNNSSVQQNVIFKKADDDLGVNYNIYKDEQILYSSTPDYYNAGLLDAVLPFNVWKDLYESRLEESYVKDKVGEHSYYSVFRKSSVADNDLLIEVNSQFNTTSVPLSDVDINIFMFGVFSLALILLFIFSTILAEQISAPIRKLTNATRSLGGGDLNIEVGGNYSGEIAELISGFNMMVKKLHKSQMEMAQLERETAWKEMAKQVAHEIKNPLTPMKLSVQQLIAAYNDKSPKFDGIFEKVTTTIIAQIETLKNIASEFSNFARMPKLNIEKINLVDSIKETINLFLDEKLRIKLSCDEAEILINADHDHLNRTFVNLIRNSIQAFAKNIFVNVHVENNLCLIKVIDDGEGIPPGSIDKIFDENYTTKSSGMGLGLSMTKKFLESINGSITVKNTSKEGTTFFITIPTVKCNAN